MYKSTSQNSQSRATRATLTSTKNEHGIDPTTFEQNLDEWEALNLRKKDIEQRCAALKDSTINAQRRNEWNGIAKWKRERTVLLEELLHKIEPRLSQLRKLRRQESEQSNNYSKDTLYGAFHELAKDLLAKPVYDRIMTAAIHRCGEHQKD